MLHTVRGPLGDERTAEIHGSADHPWYNCPFCSNAVYIRTPFPDHADSSVSQGDVCRNPWCIRHPNLTLDQARSMRAGAMLELMEEESRTRNHRLAMEMIESEREFERERVALLRAEAQERGACIACALKSGRFVKHRKVCPTQKV